MELDVNPKTTYTWLYELGYLRSSRVSFRLFINTNTLTGADFISIGDLNVHCTNMENQFSRAHTNRQTNTRKLVVFSICI